MIARGVPPAVKSPYQVLISAPCTPVSESVGTSGSSGERCGVVTATGRSRPALICPMADEVVSNIISTWPPIRSTCAWLEPSYGTCTSFVPVALAKASAAMFCVLPVAAVALRSGAGALRISASSSWTVRAGTFGASTSTLGTTTMRPTGCTSFSGS